jgi:hypothetical protein
MAIRTPWRFYDPRTTEEVFLSINPEADSGSHAIVKNTKYEVAVSNYIDDTNTRRAGDTVVQDAASEQETMNYTGKVYTKPQYDVLVEWFGKNYAWNLRDDLGREFLIYVITFKTDRMRSATYRWKHSYTMNAIVLEEI